MHSAKTAEPPTTANRWQAAESGKCTCCLVWLTNLLDNFLWLGLLCTQR